MVDNRPSGVSKGEHVHSINRAVYRALYVVAIATGVPAAVLAGLFRALQRRSVTHGQAVILLQLPVVALWLPLRVAFLACEAACISLAEA